MEVIEFAGVTKMVCKPIEGVPHYEGTLKGIEQENEMNCD